MGGQWIVGWKAETKVENREVNKCIRWIASLLQGWAAYLPIGIACIHKRSFVLFLGLSIKWIGMGVGNGRMDIKSKTGMGWDFILTLGFFGWMLLWKFGEVY